LTEPSLALSLLKSCLLKNDIDCDIVEAAPLLLQWVNYDTYNFFASVYGLNDYLFTFGINPEISHEQQKKIHEILTDDQGLENRHVKKIASNANLYLHKAIKLRQEILPKYLKYLLHTIDFSQYDLIGLTCQFDQTWASLAMAKEIKRYYPATSIVLGGNAVSYSAAKPLLACFKDIDFIVSGDGEPTLPELVLSLKTSLPWDNIPNLYFRNSDGKIQKSSKMNIHANLNDNPSPNFDHWINLQKYMRDNFSINLGSKFLPFESSRGCWWGEKKQCIFCGISKNDINFREKHPQKIFSELSQLSEKYNITTFRFSDYIAPKSHFRNLFPLLKKSGVNFNFIMETKSNLSIDEISIAAEAGVKIFQPGIESFSTTILKKMNKGVSGIRNIFCLFQMMRFGIRPAYNILYSFPGDKYSDYQWMLSIIPHLSHIVPPMTVLPVQLTQHSFLKNQADILYINNQEKLVPHKWYSLLKELHVFNENQESDDIFYLYQLPNDIIEYFDKSTRSAFRLLQIFCMQWEESFGNGAKLHYKTNEDDGMIVYDNRIPDNPQIFNFSQEHRLVYEILLNGIFDIPTIVSKTHIDSKKISNILEELSEKYVILRENKKYTALAFPEKFNNMEKY
jgi:ribosomal peptide maturation radical SAM protein 1